MDIFRNATAVRLRSHHERYLVAAEDQETVTQNKNGLTRSARWMVEVVESQDSMIRLKSCYGKYLTASNQPFLVGRMSGRKVLQTLPSRLDSSLEWRPIKEGTRVRFMTHYDHFLKANSRLPPWRNSIIHDVPHRSSSQDWVLWDVEVLEHMDHQKNHKQEPRSQGHSRDHECDDHGHDHGNVRVAGPVPGPVEVWPSDMSDVEGSNRFQQQQEPSECEMHSPLPDGRLIFYHVADEHGDVDQAVEAKSFLFKGHNVTQLSQKLKEYTQLQDIFICTRSPINGKLYPLRLQLPPNNQEMNVVVISSTSQLGLELTKGI